jgi:protein-L-isoaspartate(D-aspartate) O-methyltransferase
MDIEQARFNMVEQQIRTWDVLDTSILDLLFILKREDFVPVAYRSLAFVDMEIPLGRGQVMMAPKMEARIVQELDLKPADRVLEIGTGSGYLTALLAGRAESVTSIEYFEDFSRAAGETLARLGILNVHLKVGDAARTPAGHIGAYEKFDAVVLTGSVPVLPEAYLNVLNNGGRLFAVTGDAPVMEASLYTKTGDAAFGKREIFETVLPALVNAQQPSRFDF